MMKEYSMPILNRQCNDFLVPANVFLTVPIWKGSCLDFLLLFLVLLINVLNMRSWHKADVVENICSADLVHDTRLVSSMVLLL
jgi:hypothetical protein